MQKKESKTGGTEPETQGPESQSARAAAVETLFSPFDLASGNNLFQDMLAYVQGTFRVESVFERH